MGKKLLTAFLAFAVVLFMAGFAQAQPFSTVYVDATNGSNGNTGENETNNPPGTGPVATIEAGLNNLDNGGTLVIKAGQYDGIDFGGTDISIDQNSNMNNDLSTLTIELNSTDLSDEIDITDGDFEFNIDGGTLNITSPGNAYISLAEADGTDDFNLLAGSVNIDASSTFRLSSGAEIHVTGDAGLTGAAPQSGANTELRYTGGENITAGPESQYGDYGTGMLTVDKTQGTSVTFPSDVDFAAIQVTEGVVTFQGNVTLDNVGDANNDFVNTGNGTVTVEGTANFSVNDAGADANVVSVMADATGGSIIFEQTATWSASEDDDDVDLTGTPIIDNNGGGALAFNGGVNLSTAAVTTNNDGVIVQVQANNDAAGDLTIGGSGVTAADNPDESDDARLFKFDILNSSTGTASVNGGALRTLTNGSTGTFNVTAPVTLAGAGAGLVNDNGGSVSIAGGTINGILSNDHADSEMEITGATEVTGVFTNLGAGTGDGVVLGANNLTLSGVKPHDTAGGTVTSTSGGIVVDASTTAQNLDGVVTTANPVSININAHGFETGDVVNIAGNGDIPDGYYVVTRTDADNFTVPFDNSGGGGDAGGAVTGVTQFNGGTLSNLTVMSGSYAHNSAAVTVTDLTVSGTYDVTTDVTAEGNTMVDGGTLMVASEQTLTTDGFTQDGGTFTMAAGAGGNTTTLDVNNDFTRISGTFTANTGGDGSAVIFSGTNEQVFAPGPNLQLHDLSFTNTDGTITLSQSVRINGAGDIANGAIVDLSSLNIILNSSTATFDNSGSYTATGGGGLIIGGTGLVSGGIGTGGQVLTGNGDYSFITVALNAGQTVDIETGDGFFTGTLTLNSGNARLDAAGAGNAVNFSPKGGNAMIRINPELSTGISENSGGGNTATFNSEGNPYDLEYFGEITNDQTVGSELTSDVVNVAVSITRNADGDEEELRLPDSDVVITGDLTVNSGAYLATNTTSAANDLEVQGNLTVNGVLESGVGANAGTVTLSGDDGVHSVPGMIDATGLGNHVITLQVTGTSASIAGSANLDDTNQINAAIEVDAPDVSLADLEQVGDNIIVGANSAADLTLSLLADNAGNPGIVTGNIQLAANATQLTVGSAIEVQDGMDLDAGEFALGSNDVELTTGGVFDAETGVTYTGDGFVILDGATDFESADPIPNVRVASNVDISSASEVSTMLQVAADIDLDANLTLSGDAVFEGGGITETTGDFIVTGTTLTFETDISITDLVVNTETDNDVVTIASDDSETARTVTISDKYTQTQGTLALGMNHLNVTGTNNPALTRAAGQVTATSGAVIFAGSAAQTFETNSDNSGDALTFVNLTIDNSNGVTNADPDEAFNLSGILDLTDGTLTTDEGTLDLGANAHLIRRTATATLSSVPSFPSATADLVDVTYDIEDGEGADVNTANELPAEVRHLTIDNAEITGTEDAVVVGANLTVNGTLTLTDGELDEGGNAVTVASGGTISRANGSFDDEDNGDPADDDAPTVSSYHLEYTATNTTHTEYQPSETILSLSIHGDDVFVAMTASGTVDSLNVNTPDAGNNGNDGLDLDGKILTVTGNVNFLAGSIDDHDGGAEANSGLVFGGTEQQMLTVSAAGLAISEGSVTIDNPQGVMLEGGNLDLADAFQTGGNGINGANLVLNNGLLNLGGNVLLLDHGSTTAPNQVVQGYTRNVTTGMESHVVGDVRKVVDVSSATDRGNVTFPVGSGNPEYRPVTLYLNDPPSSDVTLTVNHVNESPGGVNGLPLDTDVGTITNYPNFYWEISSSITLSPSTQFDMSLQGDGYTDFPEESVEDIRLIRRFAGSTTNEWLLQGVENYDNSLDAQGNPTVTARNATGGISTQGAIFTFGQTSIGPTWVSAMPDTTINEGDTLNFTYEAEDRDIGQTATMSAVTIPEGATFDAETGEFQFITGPQSAGEYTATIRAIDPDSNITDTTATITVNDMNIAPTFTAELGDTTVNENSLLEFTFEATDQEPDDVLTFGLMDPAPNGASIVDSTGLFSWTPTSSQADSTYMVTVYVTDGIDTVESVSNITVQQTPLMYGDVSQNGTVDQFDAALVLQHTVGNRTLTGDSLTVADVSGNGEVSPLDASYILQYSVGLIDEFPVEGMAKAAVATGSISWNTQRAAKSDAMLVSMDLGKETRNVTAVKMDLYYDASQVTVSDFASVLPEDWMVYKNTDEDGVVKVAMAGTTPIEAGKLASFKVAFADKKANADFSGDITLNESVSRSLDGLSVKNLPSEYALNQNYPNPFNPTTTIEYQLPEETQVNISVYNMVGQKVKTLMDKTVDAGYHEVQWDATNDNGVKVSAGVYFYRITTQDFSKTHKMVLIK